MGLSLALTGTWFLTEELERAGSDLELAFVRYEKRQRPYAEAGQASVGAGADLVVPATQAEIDARNDRIRAIVAG